ncbi:unnamed protein product [Adineta steineri]|uniref:Uncharacterized protein n=1 Tax=Adineta steineri TaxID=433720 RepID=A0A820PAF3_9BILA|nr:unnamed protein product [Adineta steineri]
MTNTISSAITPQSSSFEEDSMLGFGVSDEEVYVGSGVDQQGKLGGYLLEGSYVGNAKGLFENDFLVSHEGG